MRYAEEKPTTFCCNWIAVLSYTGALALSVAIWGSLFRVVGHLIK